MDRRVIIAAGVVAAWLGYEALRAFVARRVRANTPPILQAEIARQSRAAGILGPVLGTPVVAEVVGAVAEQTILDTLPTIIGPREYSIQGVR
jgi:hypothetical protein